MPDVTIRQGWFGSWKGREWAARETPGVYVLPGEGPEPCAVVTGATAADVAAWRTAWLMNRGQKHRVQRSRCRAAKCRKTTKNLYDFGTLRVKLCDEHAPTRGEDGAWEMLPGVELKPYRAPAEEAPDARSPENADSAGSLAREAASLQGIVRAPDPDAGIPSWSSLSGVWTDVETPSVEYVRRLRRHLDDERERWLRAMAADTGADERDRALFEEWRDVRERAAKVDDEAES